MESLWWSLIGLVSGAVPYSVILGRVAKGREIRDYGDGNPGAFNVLRAAGPALFVVAALLDGFKGAIPVAYAWHFAGVKGWWIVPVALAPVVGHAFSPFLRFRGGKAVAVSFGIWLGLSGPWAPFVIGGALSVVHTVVATSGWSVVLAGLICGGVLWPLGGAEHPELMAVWGGNMGLLVWKHRHELAELPVLRGWLRGRQ